MKRPSFAELLLLALAIVLLASCASTDNAVSYAEGYELTGLEAADFYLSRLQKQENVELRYNYIYSLYEGKDYLQAAEEAKAAEPLYPDYIRFHYIEALACQALEDTEGYRNALRGCLTLDPTDKEVLHRLLASLVDDTDKKEEADSIARQLLVLDKKDEAAIAYLARYSEFYSALVTDRT